MLPVESFTDMSESIVYLQSVILHFFLEGTIDFGLWLYMSWNKFWQKQARKSSEDTHLTEYARFEKVWAA